MQIVMRKVSELTPYAKNAKKHDEKQIANVANSIKRFGWQQPIVIDEQGVVVIGHCRLLAAKKLKMKEVPVTIASGLTEDEIKELRIADNKTNESPWDLDLLAEDVQGLDFEGFDLNLSKIEFTDEELDALMDEEADRRKKDVKHRVIVDCISEDEASRAETLLKDNGFTPRVENG